MPETNVKVEDFTVSCNVKQENHLFQLCKYRGNPN